ncbi:Ankyrin repeat, SAM and basic leucine zipper domain-containing protein 1 [Sciurus carolinensis]|uniref:Ankyrin repeat, SAM and basic leucine zipper domain-containing protein 1 n=1 Tax=Sciurus carolinensis TaxID=30640 RepID=A0AA41N9Z8_SCICA|nr:Ankyrin repeat, SAM and basic leucine zipper domain-containing protein 1 [Sciurus carolinensis]
MAANAVVGPLWGLAVAGGEESSDSEDDGWQIWYLDRASQKLKRPLPTEEKNEMFKKALTTGDTSLVEELLDSGISVHCKFRYGWTPLIYAASIANVEMVQLLLDRGANANFDKDKQAVLMTGCSACGSEEQILKCVELLLSRNIDPSVTCRRLMTPIMYAAQDGHPQVVALLVAHGAEVNAQDENGYAVLHAHLDRGAVKVLTEAKGYQRKLPKQVTEDILKPESCPGLKLVRAPRTSNTFREALALRVTKPDVVWSLCATYSQLNQQSLVAESPDLRGTRSPAPEKSPVIVKCMTLDIQQSAPNTSHKAWRKYWFILWSSQWGGDPGVLEYYKHDQSKKLLGIIILCPCEQVDTNVTFYKKWLPCDFVFLIKTSVHTFYLMAETKEDMHKLVQSIHQVCGFQQEVESTGVINSLKMQETCSFKGVTLLLRSLPRVMIPMSAGSMVKPKDMASKNHTRGSPTGSKTDSDDPYIFKAHTKTPLSDFEIPKTSIMDKSQSIFVAAAPGNKAMVTSYHLHKPNHVVKPPQIYPS